MDNPQFTPASSSSSALSGAPQSVLRPTPFSSSTFSAHSAGIHWPSFGFQDPDAVEQFLLAVRAEAIKKSSVENTFASILPLLKSALPLIIDQKFHDDGAYYSSGSTPVSSLEAFIEVVLKNYFFYLMKQN